MARVYFDAWGIGRKWETPAYAVGDTEVDSESVIVARAIAAKNNLYVLNLQSEGSRLDSEGNIVANQYKVAIGKGARYGGWNIHTTIFFEVKV